MWLLGGQQPVRQKESRWRGSCGHPGKRWWWKVRQWRWGDLARFWMVIVKIEPVWLADRVNVSDKQRRLGWLPSSLLELLEKWSPHRLRWERSQGSCWKEGPPPCLSLLWEGESGGSGRWSRKKAGPGVYEPSQNVYATRGKNHCP